MPEATFTDEQIQELLGRLAPEKATELTEEMALSKDLVAAVLATVERMKAGETVEWAELIAALDEIAQAHGHEYGLPMPDIENGHRFVPAKRTPLAHTNITNPIRTEYGQELATRNMKIRNSWESLGDVTVTVIDTDEGPMSLKTLHAGQRLRKMIDGMSLRASLPNMTADAEMKAMETIKKKLSVGQWNSYALNGIFPERSKRSDIYYFFRKGLPTIAVSYHKNKGGRVLAALCLHPIGYYTGTYVGAMTPTDEVIAHLILMRGDERRFWAKSGQWHPSDPRSGI